MSGNEFAPIKARNFHLNNKIVHKISYNLEDEKSLLCINIVREFNTLTNTFYFHPCAVKKMIPNYMELLDDAVSKIKKFKSININLETFGKKDKNRSAGFIEEIGYLKQIYYDSFKYRIEKSISFCEKFMNFNKELEEAIIYHKTFPKTKLALSIIASRFYEIIRMMDEYYAKSFSYRDVLFLIKRRYIIDDCLPFPYDIKRIILKFLE